MSITRGRRGGIFELGDDDMVGEWMDTNGFVHLSRLFVSRNSAIVRGLQKCLAK